MVYTMASLNQMGEDDFASALGNIFEDSPAIARRSWHKRPFETVEALHTALVSTMRELDNPAQLALIRTHPELGTDFGMSNDSRQEQYRSGLNDITSHEANRLQMLNRTYVNKFGFPFVLSIKRQTISSILDILEHRLQHTISQEIEQALTEIEKIAWFRLIECVEQPS